MGLDYFSYKMWNILHPYPALNIKPVKSPLALDYIITSKQQFYLPSPPPQGYNPTITLLLTSVVRIRIPFLY